jgi:hypothetical protein
MNIKTAQKHFQRRFAKDSKGNFYTFKVESKDVEAINCIFTEMNKRDERTLAKNNLFAKLLVYQYTQNIRYHETTILSDLNLAQVELCKILEYPLESIYKGFYNDLHGNQLNRLVKYGEVNDGIDVKVAEIRDGKLGVEDFLLAKHDGLEGYIKHLESGKITDEEQINVIKSLQQNKKTFTFAYVTDKLNEMVTEAYNRFN